MFRHIFLAFIFGTVLEEHHGLGLFCPLPTTPVAGYKGLSVLKVRGLHFLALSFQSGGRRCHQRLQCRPRQSKAPARDAGIRRRNLGGHPQRRRRPRLSLAQSTLGEKFPSSSPSPSHVRGLQRSRVGPQWPPRHRHHKGPDRVQEAGRPVLHGRVQGPGGQSICLTRSFGSFQCRVS